MCEICNLIKNTSDKVEKLIEVHYDEIVNEHREGIEYLVEIYYPLMFAISGFNTKKTLLAFTIFCLIAGMNLKKDLLRNK